MHMEAEGEDLDPHAHGGRGGGPPHAHGGRGGGPPHAHGGRGGGPPHAHGGRGEDLHMHVEVEGRTSTCTWR